MLRVIPEDRFELHVSVALALEYEDILRRQLVGARSASGRTLPAIEARTPSDQRERPGQKVASHQRPGMVPGMRAQDIDDFLDYLLQRTRLEPSVPRLRTVLPDPDDESILELAAQCGAII
ncbi:MAG: hypothetical protein EPN33_01670 [Acidobacteria bacterium]|nr:MAG: hypothetical protein EPN33_01670 [Acidobacteriota bacterium]